MICPACGEPMAPRPGWTTCLTCRRAGRTPPPRGFQPERRTCGKPGCGLEFEAKHPNHLYCRPEHRPGRQRPSAGDRGYGHDHRDLREQWRPKVEAGRVDCHAVLCLVASARGRRIQPGEKWDLGHNPERTAWTGPEHRGCNRSEGARRKQAMARSVCTIVCGPPCSGKSTYVAQRAAAGDLVVDHDAIAQRLGSGRTHGHTKLIREAAEREVERLLREIQAGKHQRSWVIRTAPRHDLARRLGAELVVLTEPRSVLVERAARRSNPRHTISLIDWWLRTYGRG